MASAFPQKAFVWRGAILGGIVNATKVAESTSYGHFAAWNCLHYILNDGSGNEGVLAFAGGHWYPDAPLVGVFHQVHSPRFSVDRDEIGLESVFRNCPPYQRALADYALYYLQLDYHGKTLHRVTAAFWDDRDYLVAADPWGEVRQHGADLIDNELIEDIKGALGRWQQGYQMTSEQLFFVDQLFQRKMARPAGLIELTRAQAEWLQSMAGDPKTMKSCRQQFRALGILVPELDH